MKEKELTKVTNLKEAKGPEYYSTKLPNDMRVVVATTEEHMVTIALRIQTGPIFETHLNSGSTHYWRRYLYQV